MNKFGFAAVVASGLAAAILGLAAPAQAATAVYAPTVIDIPADFGHHAAAVSRIGLQRNAVTVNRFPGRWALGRRPGRRNAPLGSGHAGGPRHPLLHGRCVAGRI